MGDKSVHQIETTPSATEIIEINNFTRDDDEIVLPSCADLDWAQIAYAVNAKHLMFITNSKTWLGFHNTNLKNSHKYYYLTEEQLCQRFLKRILPNILKYELSDHEEYLLSLLDLHPNFERTTNGFDLINNFERLNFPADIAATQTIMNSEMKHEIGFKADVVHSNKQIIITDSSLQTSYTQFFFSEENVALLSIIFGSDDELPSSGLLTIKEIRKRFKAAKSNYEFSGQQPINLNISIYEILKKLSTIRELKVAITKLLESFTLS